MPQKHKQFDSDDDDDQDYSEPLDRAEVGRTPVADVADDDSDEAPENISSGQSKMDSLQQMRNIVSHMKDTRERQRQKNRQHAELYAAQKAARLEQLEACRLPAEVKDTLSEDVGRKSKTPVTRTPGTQRTPLDEHEDAESEEVPMPEEEIDFIPLGTGSLRRGVHVVRVKDSLSHTSAQSAAEFRQASLGGARVKRVPVKSRMALTAKRQARFF